MRPALEQVLPLLAAAADAQGLRWMLVGATARDLLIAPHLPHARLRASLDLDLAVQVESWSAFDRLRTALLAKQGFREQRGNVHRLVHVEAEVEVDILPYGGVADAEGYLQWPDNDTSMRVSFYPAIEHSALARELAGVPVRVPSAAGLVAAKLAAWRDAPSRGKDIEDAWFVMVHYLDLVDEERLYSGEDADLLAMLPFDYRLAAIRMLGRDVKVLDNEVVAPTVLMWLNEEAFVQRLALALRRCERALTETFARGVVDALKAGLADSH